MLLYEQNSECHTWLKKYYRFGNKFEQKFER